MVNEVYCICERASGECEVFDGDVIRDVSYGCKGKQALCFIQEPNFPFFKIVKYLLKMYCCPHTLSIPSSRNFIEENRLKKSTHHTMRGATVKTSLMQLLKCLKIHVLCART